MATDRARREAADSASGQARPAAFISYAPGDKEFVSRLEERLRTEGKIVWVDWKDIKPTAEWRAKV